MDNHDYIMIGFRNWACEKIVPAYIRASQGRNEIVT